MLRNHIFPRSPDMCQACSTKDASKQCARCKRVRYCNTRCAERDYAKHKIECRFWKGWKVDTEVIRADDNLYYLIDNIRDTDLHRKIGSTCRSWRSYISSLYELDMNHELYYTDDNLLGIVYSHTRWHPDHIADIHTDPVYSKMAKSGKECVKVFAYMKQMDHHSFSKSRLLYKLCEFGNPSFEKVMKEYFTYSQPSDIISVDIRVLLELGLIHCRGSLFLKNIIIIAKFVQETVQHNRSFFSSYDLDELRGEVAQIIRERSEHAYIVWMEYMRFDSNAGLQLFESFKVQFDGTIVRNLDESGNAITEHIGAPAEDCFICNHLGKNLSGTDFQYKFGTIHERKDNSWQCILGNVLIDEYTDAYAEILTMMYNL